MFSKTIIKNMFYAFLVSFSLSLFAPGAMADASSDLAEQRTENAISEIVSKPINLNEDGGEYFHIWMSKIFGEFIFAPWDSNYEGGTVTPLAHAVGFTNILAIILGLVIVYYVMLGGAVNTAHSGEVLGKEWSSVWIPVRTATGFSLVMPITTVGGGVLSFAQMFIIWVIILGSNAATVLWEQSVENFLSPSSIRTTSLKVGIKPTTDMAKMLNCTQNYMTFLALDKNQGEIKTSGKTIATIYYSNDTIKKVLSSTWDDKVDSFSVSGLSISSHMQTSSGTGGMPVYVNSIEFAHNGNCGSIELNSQKTDSAYTDFNSEATYKEKAMDSAFAASSLAVGKALDELAPLIAKYANDNEVISETVKYRTEEGFNTEDPGSLAAYNTDVKSFYGYAKNFNKNLVQGVFTAISSNPAIQEQWKKDMIEGGWAQAGIWFYELGSLEQMSYTVINSFSTSSSSLQMCQPEIDFFSFFTSDECENALGKMEVSSGLIDSFSSDSILYAKEKGYNDVITGFDRTKGDCAVGSTCTTKSENISSASVSSAKFILDTMAEGSNVTSRTDGLASPFQTVTSIGNTLNVIAETTFIAAGFASGLVESGVAATDNVPGKYTGAFSVMSFAKAVLNWYLQAVLALCATLLTCGFTLAYALPLLPIVTWILMMTGYLITVVEAVVAAPLAIILMVTPEGSGIAGTRLERAMSLIAVAVLKPSLMIIGLIAAITISGVAFSIQNEFFFVAAKHNMYGNILDFIAIIIIYTMTTLQLCKLLISIMHTLPNQILEWFSSGVGSRSFGEDAVANAVESGSGSMGSFASGAGKTMGDTFAKSSRERRRASLYKQNSEDQESGKNG